MLINRSQHCNNTQVERFNSHITHEPNTGCWLWTGCVTIPVKRKSGNYSQGGYGLFQNGKKLVLAHRFALQSQMVDLLSTDRKQMVDHTCHTRSCVNPSHLRLVSAKENRKNLTDTGAKTLRENGLKNTKNLLRTGSGVYGEASAHKLSDVEVAEIRTQYATGSYTLQDLADQYRCGTSQVSRIVNNKSRCKVFAR